MTEPRKQPGWIFWTAIVLLALAVYVFSLGPACWLTAKAPGDSSKRPKWLVIYLPFGMWLLQERGDKLLRWWMCLGTKEGNSVMVPCDTTAKKWRGFEKQ